MRYVSSRGGQHQATFEDTLFSGYCTDGGLYMPESVPKLSRDTIRAWSDLSYVELAKRIARLYITEEEVPTSDLNECLDKAFRSFTDPKIAPVAKLSGGLNILELFHGRTMSFKDLALSCVGHFLKYFLNKRKRHVVIVVVTSGDTGSAAIDCVRGKEWLDIVVFLPTEGCSEIQERQMTTVLDDNVHVFKVKSPVKVDDAVSTISQDKSFSDQHGFMTINSTNWARIMIQTVHFFYGYFQVCEDVGQEVEFIVPTGACGDVTAGIIAREMGLPIKLVSAVNTNDIVARVITKGDYSVGTWIHTMAPAMDIQINTVLSTHVAGDDRIKVVIRRCWEADGYALCPHTAVGVSYFYETTDNKLDMSDEHRPVRLCVATASPAKFPEALTAAGIEPKPSPKLKGLANMPTKFETVPSEQDHEQFVRTVISRITAKKTCEAGKI